MRVIDRSLSGVFCDDIRNELHGKVSLIGCYGTSMEFPSFPITLPQLGAHVIVQTPCSRPFRSLSFRVLRDEELLMEGEIPSEAFPDRTVVPGDEFRLHKVQVQFKLSPLHLEAPCTLKVRAQVDGEELRGLALTVNVAPEQADSSGI